MTQPQHYLRAHATELFEVATPEDSIPLALEALYTDFNGGYFWGRALLIRPRAGLSAVLTVSAWNEPERWKGLYAGRCDSVIFFAEDAFGGQFGVLDGRFVQFDPETSEIVVIAENAEEWVSSVLRDANYLTGAPVAAAWEKKHGPLPPGCRLVPKQAFMLGGQFHSSNMACKSDVEGMRIRAGLWQATKDLSDGQKIVFKRSE